MVRVVRVICGSYRAREFVEFAGKVGGGQRKDKTRVSWSDVDGYDNVVGRRTLCTIV